MAQGARTLLQSSRASDEDLGLITLATASPPVSRVPEGTITRLSDAIVGGVGSADIITNGGDAAMRWAPVVKTSALASTGIATPLDWVCPPAEVGGGASSPPAGGALLERLGKPSLP